MKHTNIRKRALCLFLVLATVMTLNVTVFAADPIYVAQNGEVLYETLAEAVEMAAPGDTVTLLDNVTLTGGDDRDTDAALVIDKALTIDGQDQYTIDCGTFKKGIRIYNDNEKWPPNGERIEVIFANVTVVNSNANGRCVDMRGTRLGWITLTLEDADFTALGVNSQPITVGGDSEGYTMNVNVHGGSVVNAGASGYGIISFNKSSIHVEGDSLVTGYTAAYFKAGSDGSQLFVNGGNIASVNTYDGDSNNFATVVASEAANIDVTVQNHASVKATATGTAKQALVALGEGTSVTMATNNVELELNGENTWVILNYTGTQSVVTHKAGADMLNAQGYAVEQTDSKYKVAGVAVASINGTGYATLEKAIAAAEAGDTITLLDDIILAGGDDRDTEAGIIIDKTVTIDGQDQYTIDCGTFAKGIRIYNYNTDWSPNDYKITVTFANLTIVNNNNYGRAVDMRGTRLGWVNTVFDDADIVAHGVNSQGITLGGNTEEYSMSTTVTGGSNIDAGDSGYGIISFNRSSIKVQNATVSGYAAIYMKEGSEQSDIFVNGQNTRLIGNNIYDGDHNNFATIVVEAEDVSVTAQNHAELSANASGTASQAVIALAADTEVNIWNNNVSVEWNGENAKLVTNFDGNQNVTIAKDTVAAVEAEGEMAVATVTTTEGKTLYRLASEIAAFRGGSIRYSVDGVEKDPSATDLRFGFLVDANLPEDAVIDSWYWNYGVSADDLSISTEGVENNYVITNVDGKDMIASNIVLTNISADHYADTIYVEIVVTYTLADGTVYKVSGPTESRSVMDIVDGIIAKGEDAKGYDYALKLQDAYNNANA